MSSPMEKRLAKAIDRYERAEADRDRLVEIINELAHSMFSELDQDPPDHVADYLTGELAEDCRRLLAAPKGGSL